MRCALVDLNTNIVVNLIIADPEADPAPVGYLIVGLLEGSQVEIGWSYNSATGEFTPPLE